MSGDAHAPVFPPAEYAARRARLDDAMDEAGLGALLLFAPESHYWLTGYDTFGYCFFQTMLVPRAGEPVLLTRSADLRQAQLTSTVTDIRVWEDGTADLGAELAALLEGAGPRIGVEIDTHGLTAANWRRVEPVLAAREWRDASALVPALRLTKSPAEIEHVRRAAALADEAYDAAMGVVAPGANEADVLAAMQGAVLSGGGDYPANPFIVGSGRRALLCRYATGRRSLSPRDQITLEWAGVSAHYHAVLMRTVIVGEPRTEHRAMHAAAREALLACEAALVPGTAMGEVFEAHAATLDEHGLGHARLAACGYSLGARYAPSWMEPQMFRANEPTAIAPGQVMFLHMILMDSTTGAAMTLGRTSLIGDTGPEPLSRLSLEMDVVA